MSLVEIFHAERHILVVTVEWTMVVVTILELSPLAKAGNTDIGFQDALQAFGIERAVAR
jgi:hypothetical protein